MNTSARDVAGPPRRPAGLGRRIGAFVLDVLVLGLFGTLLGLVAKDWLIALGPWGRLLGFFIALLYFVPQYSKLCGGQTLGKRLLQLRVVGRDGQPVGLGRATLRYLVIGLPWFLNGAWLPADLMLEPLAGALLTVLTFGLGVSGLYLVLFNRRTGQGLHDLAAGTHVLGQDRAMPAQALPKLHRYVAAGILGSSLVLPPLLGRLVTHSNAMDGVLQTWLAVQATGDVYSSQVTRGATFFRKAGGNPNVTRQAQVVAQLKRWPDDPQAEARKLAGLVLRYVKPDQVDMIVIDLSYGYDIGISHSWHGDRFAKEPWQWTADDPVH